MSSTQCASYSTPNDLQFSLFCNSNTADSIGNIKSVGALDAEDCMKQCSVHPGTICGAVAFDSNTLKCFLKNTTVTAASALSIAGWTLGIANPIQFNSLPTSCPNNGQRQTSKNGLDFLVFCDQDIGGHDTCTDQAPNCRIHANTIDECLDHCSTMPAPCTGVAWDPTLRHGWANCYPKVLSPKDFDDLRTPVTSKIRCARSLLEYPTDVCRSKITGAILSINEDKFTLNCDQDRQGNNITTQHSDTLDQCIDSCAKHINPTCIGAVFDSNMTLGYQNCHLKSAIGLPLLEMKGFAFALRQDYTNETTILVNGTITTPPNGTNNPNIDAQPQTPAKNMAWIAGPVVGAVVAIAVILLAVRWWRTRGREKDNYIHETRVGSEIEPKFEPDQEALQEALQEPMYELGQSHNRRIHEM